MVGKQIRHRPRGGSAAAGDEYLPSLRNIILYIPDKQIGFFGEACNGIRTDLIFGARAHKRTAARKRVYRGGVAAERSKKLFRRAERAAVFKAAHTRLCKAFGYSAVGKLEPARTLGDTLRIENEHRRIRHMLQEVFALRVDKRKEAVGKNTAFAVGYSFPFGCQRGTALFLAVKRGNEPV